MVVYLRLCSRVFVFVYLWEQSVKKLVRIWCDSRAAADQSVKIEILPPQANLIQTFHSYSVLGPATLNLSCIHSIFNVFLLLFHSFSIIHWLTQSPFRFWTFIPRNPIKIWNLFCGKRARAPHPMNSLAPAKALLSGWPLTILGNLNGLLWVFYELGEETDQH